MSAAVYYVHVYGIAGIQAFSTSYVRNNNERNVRMYAEKIVTGLFFRMDHTENQQK